MNSFDSSRRVRQRCVATALAWVLVATFAPAAHADARTAPYQPMDWIRVSRHCRGFALARSACRFVPWGFNYDHDEQGRLIEDYWFTEWPKVEQDFYEMKQLGANTVRIHLQLGRFMAAPNKPDERSLAQLERLLDLAERSGLYLDLTGLGCYHKADVPPWYDSLPEGERWQVQVRFWEAVAARCAKSPAVFCYDLMNEPAVPDSPRDAGDWLGAGFAGSHFLQFITLDTAGREPAAIVQAWVRLLVGAVRKHDPYHLITVGLLDGALELDTASHAAAAEIPPVFPPQMLAAELDFLSIHTYPERCRVVEALQALQDYSVGKPVLIEETFPLKCDLAEFACFIEGSRAVADGWLGFYWGKTPHEYSPPKSISDAITLGWLQYFQRPWCWARYCRVACRCSCRTGGHCLFPRCRHTRCFSR